MPEEGIQLSEKESLMTHEEVIFIAKQFVEMGVKKIRLTGGEPLIKKNVEKIITELAQLPINLGITTNGILLDNFFFFQVFWSLVSITIPLISDPSPAVRSAILLESRVSS